MKPLSKKAVKKKSIRQELRVAMKNRRRRCPACTGSGVIHAVNEHGEYVCQCPVCDSTGWVPDEKEQP